MAWEEEMSALRAARPGRRERIFWQVSRDVKEWMDKYSKICCKGGQGVRLTPDLST